MPDRPRHLRPLHVALAFLIVAVWGTNFVVIKAGLDELPPFLFATLRFVACFLPFAFFIARPRVPWRWLALYGAVLGAGQFAPSISRCRCGSSASARGR